MRIEAKTPNETEKTIQELRQMIEDRDVELTELRQKQEKLESMLSHIVKLSNTQAGHKFLEIPETEREQFIIHLSRSGTHLEKREELPDGSTVWELKKDSNQKKRSKDRPRM